METDDRIYYGATPKYAIEIVGDGFNMETDDFEIVLKGSRGEVTIKKKDTFQDDDGKFYFFFDTEELGVGRVKAVVTANVPDDDIPKGTRREVYVIDWFAHIYAV